MSTKSDRRPTTHRPKRGRPDRLRGLLAGGFAVAGAALVLAFPLQRSAGGEAPGEATVDAPVEAATPRAPGPTSAAVPLPVEPAVVLRTKPPTAHAHAGVPVGVQIPELDLDAPVIGVDPVDGVLLPPADPSTLGWWRGGAQPGAVHGGALITAHTLHAGGGAFDDLEHLSRGDGVTVRTTEGQVGYRVTDVVIYEKQSLAAQAAEVFSQSVPGRLVLVTCEDWNGSGYDSNVVVLADPEPAG